LDALFKQAQRDASTEDRLCTCDLCSCVAIPIIGLGRPLGLQEAETSRNYRKAAPAAFTLQEISVVLISIRD